MKLEQIRSIAKLHSISPGKLSAIELVKAIQAKEGNFDCFATAVNGECDQVGCSWRDDCFAASSKGGLS
ncbi:MAG: SAP domain-containing protein [Nitrosomonadales bacterium]|nr:SAP domain-containing protein [Nitrosomonadales bacterium]